MQPRIGANTNRARLYAAQGGECGGCGGYLGRDLTIDHVVPKARGGSSALSNMLLMHAVCNNAKANQLPNAFETNRNDRKNKVLNDGRS